LPGESFDVKIGIDLLDGVNFHLTRRMI
jgi:hypothetical protein